MIRSTRKALLHISFIFSPWPASSWACSSHGNGRDARSEMETCKASCSLGMELAQSLLPTCYWPKQATRINPKSRRREPHPPWWGHGEGVALGNGGELKPFIQSATPDTLSYSGFHDCIILRLFPGFWWSFTRSSHYMAVDFQQHSVTYSEFFSSSVRSLNSRVPQCWPLRFLL